MPNPVSVSHLSVDDWEHAFVTGNGRQGAACYGGPRALRVTLSHERLFLSVDEPLDPPDTGRILPRLREQLYAGNFQHAADEVMTLAAADDPRYRGLRHSDPFVGAATLTFIPDGQGSGEPAGAGRRTVDFATGVVTQEWGDHRQEVFVSRVHDVVVIRIRARGTVSGRVHLGPIGGPPPTPVQVRSTAAGDRMSFEAAFTARWPGGLGGYLVTCRVLAAGGTVGADLGGGSMTVRGADEVLLLARTTLGPAEDTDIVADYDELLAGHASVHGGLFDRCRLDLGGGQEEALTEDLIAKPTPALVQRLFDAGRYAIISATGELPPNLQGVWSGTFEPAWRGGYTLDGNLQAALAAVATTGTPELLLPLFDLVDAHLSDFRHNAERLYRLPGILVPPHLTAHGRHNHFTERWCLTFWTAGAAWLARLYYDYWRFTGDRGFLRERALPFMREAARFYTGFMAERDGVLCFAPSYSPENSPGGDTGPQACVNATMDVATVRDLLSNLLEGTEVLGLTEPDAARWLSILARLPDYRIDDDGALAEWLWPGLPNNHAHRHASHLFGLWYEPDAALLDNPALRQAAVRSVQRRLAWWREQGDEMAFGLVQLGLAAACLGLAEDAHEIVSRLSTRYWRANLVSTHNAGAIFNTDICGGLPALVTAMLVRSRANVVRLLPALPVAWPAGSIHGVLLRGGIRLAHLTWSRDLVEAELVCSDDRELTVSARDRVRTALPARAGRPLRVSFP